VMEWRRVPLASAAGTTGLMRDGDWIIASNMDPDGDIRLIQLADIGCGTFLDRSAKFINRGKFVELACTALRAGDVLISRMADPIGRACLLPDLPYEAITAVDVTILRSDPKVADPRFIVYYCNTPEFLNAASDAATGTTRSRITRRNLERIPIPLPPFSEQRRIVEILDEADRLRRLRAEADAKADRILPALFIKMFGDPATNPMGWPVVALGNVLAQVDRCDPRDTPHQAFKYIDIAGVDGAGGEIVTTRRLLGAQAPSRARQVVRAGDVLVSTVRPYLRATAVVPSDLDGQVCSTGFCVLRSRYGYGHGYLYALTRTEWFTGQLNARARGASYPAVTDRDILQLRVPFPKAKEPLSRFDELVRLLLAQKRNRGALSGRIKALFRSLQDGAFSGSLTAHWREAHMKELLQEMEEQAKVLEAKKA
jgi:type I restriction enzyme S subunit